MQPVSSLPADSPAELGRRSASRPVHDLAIVIVSTNEANWLEPCLRTISESIGDIDLDVVVVDNETTDETRSLVESRFPSGQAGQLTEPRLLSRQQSRRSDLQFPIRPLPQSRHGNSFRVFRRDGRGHGSATGGRPGRRSAADLRRHPLADDPLLPEYSPCRGEALASEKWPRRPAWSGERELDLGVYEHEHACDWTSGSFLMVRNEALMSAGLLDERFFIYSEETDLCLRIKRAGWEVRHLPTMTIVHHAGKGGIRPKMIAQDAYTRRQYARKHFQQPQRGLFLAAILARHVVRAIGPGSQEQAKARRAAARRAMKTLCGFEGPPFSALRPKPPWRRSTTADRRTGPFFKLGEFRTCERSAAVVAFLMR